MSLPTLPTDICRKDAINQILSSIAMEAIGLSHIINAEGEKIQFALGTLTQNSSCCVCVEELLNINKSVSDTLENVIYSQIVLATKMKNAIILENMNVTCKCKNSTDNGCSDGGLDNQNGNDTSCSSET